VQQVILKLINSSFQTAQIKFNTVKSTPGIESNINIVVCRRLN